MSVSVSIVTHQSARHVEACLDAVRAQGPCVREILLADSGSRDDTLARVRAGFPEVRVHVLGRNAGFAAAHNHNFKRSRGSFWLVLNPDVVLRPGCIESLLACLRRDAALAGAAARLLAPDGAALDSAGIVYDRARTRFVDRGRGAPSSAYAREEDVLGACGAASLYRREALASVCAREESPFAERFFMYYEDVDLGWRLRRAGWRVRYCPSAEAVHARGGSGADEAFIEYHLVRNRLWLSLRNARVSELLAELPGLALFEGVKVLQAARRPHLRAALRDQLRGVPAALAERRRRRRRPARPRPRAEL